METVVGRGDFYYTWNGRPVLDLSQVPKHAVLQAHDRLPGGKGGFGSMLRAIGNQIEKTTNHEMCRDLTGRRMRDVNTEKKLQEWYAKASDREREKMQRYTERRQRRQELLAKGPLPGHKFSDREYERQKRKIDYDLQSALDTAVANVLKDKKLGSSDVAGPSCSTKKSRLWMDEEEEKLLLSDSSLSDSSCNAVPAYPDRPADVSSTVANSPLPDSLVSTSPTPETIPADQLDEQPNSPIPGTAQRPEGSSSTPCVPYQDLTPKVTVEPISDAALAEVSSATDLESFGLDVLKESLSVRGIKCGGSLQERAIRLFSVRSLHADEYPAKIRAKAKKT